MDLLALDGQSGRVVSHKFDCPACHPGTWSRDLEMGSCFSLWKCGIGFPLAVSRSELGPFACCSRPKINGLLWPRGQKSGGADADFLFPVTPHHLQLEADSPQLLKRRLPRGITWCAWGNVENVSIKGLIKGIGPSRRLFFWCFLTP